MTKEQSDRFIETLLSRMDLIAEQALGGVGLDPRAREALEKAPLSAASLAFRSKLSVALAEKACEMAETDPDGASHGLTRAANMLGPRASQLDRSRPMASLSTAFPTLSSIMSTKVRGASSISIAMKARQMREERERAEMENAQKELASNAKHEPDEHSALDDLLGGLDKDEHDAVAPKINFAKIKSNDKAKKQPALRM
jgi:hypothetical protein